jgi:hypothetical protein
MLLTGIRRMVHLRLIETVLALTEKILDVPAQVCAACHVAEILVKALAADRRLLGHPVENLCIGR